MNERTASPELSDHELAPRESPNPDKELLWAAENEGELRLWLLNKATKNIFIWLTSILNCFCVPWRSIGWVHGRNGGQSHLSSVTCPTWDTHTHTQHTYIYIYIYIYPHVHTRAFNPPVAERTRTSNCRMQGLEPWEASTITFQDSPLRSNELTSGRTSSVHYLSPTDWSPRLSRYLIQIQKHPRTKKLETITNGFTLWNDWPLSKNLTCMITSWARSRVSPVSPCFGRPFHPAMSPYSRHEPLEVFISGPIFRLMSRSCLLHGSRSLDLSFNLLRKITNLDTLTSLRVIYLIQNKVSARWAWLISHFEDLASSCHWFYHHPMSLTWQTFSIDFCHWRPRSSLGDADKCRVR